MSSQSKIYAATNCTVAFQLNWTLSIFGTASLPPSKTWLEKLKESTERDGVRILECQQPRPHVFQFFLSSKPHVSPANVIRTIKGRLQYLLRDEYPQVFRRNYRIESVGAANLETIDYYVSRQPERHQMADSRLQKLLASLQFHNPKVSLSELQRSSTGEYVHDLQIVLETRGGWSETRADKLEGIRETVVRTSGEKAFRLSRIGLLSNHLHLTLGCHVTAVPLEVGLLFLNELAFVDGQSLLFKHSFYVGTFGNFDRTAIRECLKRNRAL